MNFWRALKEALLELLIGRDRLEAWRAEDERWKECQRYARKCMEEAAREAKSA